MGAGDLVTSLLVAREAGMDVPPATPETDGAAPAKE